MRAGLRDLRSLASAELEAGDRGAFGKSNGGRARWVDIQRAIEFLDWLDQGGDELALNLGNLIDPDRRRALADYFGQSTISNRSIVGWAFDELGATLDGMLADYEAEKEATARKGTGKTIRRAR